MEDGCKVYMESFLRGIERIMFHGHLDYFQKNHLLEVGRTRDRKTMALRTLITVDLVYFIMSEDLHA